ncbi:penicillin-binding protein activator [Qipengyuania sediminis]|uniref:penicillin-binding protein activator n=1 Tax=Qipengyuania sediminis TaxID=1532023 RepID=UPI001059E1B7|nr:penicillin-binding protein activator [Qipengyuania sediminis]
MKAIAITRRALIVGGTAALLGACQVIPKAPRSSAPPVTTPTPPPSTGTLPADRQRHRVALLVPMTGANAAIGQSIANATTMALLDTNASNLRITTYDTALGPQSAARRAVADGNRLILGPLMGEDIAAVTGEARAARLPVIAFSNDSARASADAFVMGQMPEQSIARSVRHLRAKGAQSFAVLAPAGEYGQRAEAALKDAVAGHGGRVAAVETYARGNTSVVSAAQRLRTRGGFDSVLIADSARIAGQAAAQFRPGTTRLFGTELWSGEAAIARTPALAGAVFSAVTDSRYKRFSDSYQARFGGAPYRLATLGYDAVLLTLRVARDWQPGRPFPTERLRDTGGFIGLDGAFRFGRDGVVERAMEVREVRRGTIAVVDPAPAGF